MTAPAGLTGVHVATDVVLFTVRNRRLEVLLGRGAGRTWRFPRGFVSGDEALTDCAAAALARDAGLHGVYLEQLYTFCLGPATGRRTVSVAYYALAPYERLRRTAGAGRLETRWFGLDQVPPLGEDLAEMLDMARRRLVAKLDYSTIAFQFLPETFTLTELQEVYEIIGGAPLDKRNFRRQILALGQLEETGDYRRNGSHRPARLYRLKAPGRVDIIKGRAR